MISLAFFWNQETSVIYGIEHKPIQAYPVDAGILFHTIFRIPSFRMARRNVLVSLLLVLALHRCGFAELGYKCKYLISVSANNPRFIMRRT